MMSNKNFDAEIKRNADGGALNVQMNKYGHKGEIGGGGVHSFG